MTIIEDREIELVYRGVQCGIGETYDEYNTCIRTALYCHYDEIPDIVIECVEQDYQGETVGLMKGKKQQNGDYWGEGNWYYYSFGWGSCSGCDMLQGSGPIETIKELKNDIIPIPLETISITEYITNELQNSYHKEIVGELLTKWQEYMKEKYLDDRGKWVRT